MSEATSRRSDDVSETSSQAADGAILKRRNQNHDGVQREEDDLLEQRKSLQEGVFAAMYMLSRSKSADSWRFAIVKIILEALIPFLIIFNPTNNWEITTSNPVWQVVRWTLPRSPVARIWGYDVYIRIFYAIVAVVYMAVGCIAALTIAMRKQEHSRSLMRYARFLQLFTEVVFALAYMSVFDYMVFLFNCKFKTHGSHPHEYFTSVECFQTPHLIHMGVAGVTAAVFFCSTALMLVASCDLNPLTRGITASPTAVTRLRVLVLKALYVIVMNTLSSVAKAQGVSVLVFAVAITYFNFTRLPFLRSYINFFWVGGWTAVSYTCGVYCYFNFHEDKDTQHVKHEMAKLVLYGVFPSAAAGVFVTTAWFWYRMYPSRKFANLDPSVKLKKVHEFSSPEDVEVVSRAMRRFDTDGVIMEEMGPMGEIVIKCGMAVFPNNVDLFILYANFLMEVKRDGPAARTQLQLALKGGPSLVQRYKIFSTIENSKRLKDGQEGQLDLQSYVEFKRNYRAVIYVHKAALTAQREFWQLMQRSSVSVTAIEAHLHEMDEAADTAHQVYKRVLERYPHNGKLLRCYGKFLEDVRNDPLAASRAYTEAARNGGVDGLLSLDLRVSGSEKPEFLTSMDLHDDACVVINAEGTILMVNSCVTTLLGYPKTELEGANVSLIMPQPFSGRHPSYLSRYVQGGAAHILDTVRDVVALHKERHVFPLQICVTKLSGVGTDAIFMGLLRPQPLDSRNMRVWVAPNGIILCTDPQFSSLTGILNEQMVGCNFLTLCTDMAAVEALLELCKEAPYEALVMGKITKHLYLVHKHLSPIPVEIMITPGGTDTQRIFVFNARRTDGQTDGLMVVDPKGALSFATWDVAAMLGYSLKKFLTLRLEQLLPQPFAAMHTKYLKEQNVIIQPTSCRAGRLVHLINSNGTAVPVRLQVSTQEDTISGKSKHIVQVRKMGHSAGKTVAYRLVLLCSPEGQILSVDDPESTLFGFTASACVGSNLADYIDLFEEWRAKAGAHQLELLLLSLLDREVEMPGTSWRVKVHSPLTEDSLPNIDPSAPQRASYGRSACLQTELVDSAEHADLSADIASSLTKIVLWRRDLLTGVVELDSKLVIRRADVDTGLILGHPPSALLKTPLHRVLDIPRGITWDELMKNKKKKSSMKSGAGCVVSAQRFLEGQHPDGGTMRLFVQGVSGGGLSRIYVTLRPDTLFQGARADIYCALGLDALMHPKAGVQPSGAHATATAATATTGGQDSKAALDGTDKMRFGEEIRNAAALRRSGGGDDTSAAATAPNVNPKNGPKQALAGDAGGGGRGRTQPGSVRKRVDQEREGGDQHDEGEASSSDDTSDDDGDEDGWPNRDRASDGDRSDRPASVSTDGGGGGAVAATSFRRDPHRRRSGGRGGEDYDDDNGDPGHLHKIAHNQSEFVAQWVQTLAKQMTGQLADVATERDAIPGSRQAARRLSSDINTRTFTATPPPGSAPGGGAGVKRDSPGMPTASSRRRNRDGMTTGSLGSRRISDGWPAGVGSASEGFGASVDGTEISPAGGGGGGSGVPPSSSGMHWGLVDRGGTMLRSNRRKLDLDPVDEERSDFPGSTDRGSEESAGEEDGAGNGSGAFDGRGGGGAPQAAPVPVSELSGLVDHRRPSDNDGVSSQGDDDEGTSQGLGPEAFTDSSSAADLDLSADARRARLMKRLCKLFSGPQLTGPLLRMRYHTWLLLAAMLVTHVVMYVILVSIINRQFSNVHEVHRLALAADRCQLATVKVVLAEFCSRPGIDAISICETSLSTTLSDLRAALEDLEAYHQTTYLGAHAVPRKIKDPTAYYLWTSSTGTYKTYFDTQPSMWVNGTAGVWQMGNRFIATAREILYWGNRLHGQIADLRAYKFVIANGPWAIFSGFTDSLDYLVNYAWEEVAQVQRALIIMLVIEAAGVQLACIVYEFILLRTVEQVRSGCLLTSLAIPGPMLRVLANRPIFIIEDSDDEDGDDDDAAADRAGGAGEGARGGGGEGADVFESEDEGILLTHGNVNNTGTAAAGNTTRRFRRMSMDFVVPAPGAVRPGDAIPYDAGGGASPYCPSRHLPNRSADSSMNLGHVLQQGHLVLGGGGGFGAPGGVLPAGRHFSTGGVMLSNSGRLKVNGKELLPSYRNTIKFLTPLLLWEVALIVVGAVSYLQLDGMQGPLASLNMASHVIYRYTRVRAFALLLVSSDPGTATMDFYRGVLKTELSNLQSEYDTLMYGGLSITQADKVFQKPVPASTFESSSFSNNFFRQERCFRWDQSKCYTPDSPYYEVTHHGLDVMLRRIVSEMNLLASDDDVDAVYNGTRYTTMYMVGTKDLYEGLQSSAQLFVDFSISRYNSIKLFQTILLVVTIVVFLLYALLLLRPYLAAVEREATRLAGLMSHVPAEMDVTMHVRQVLRGHVRGVLHRKSRESGTGAATAAVGRRDSKTGLRASQSTTPMPASTGRV